MSKISRRSGMRPLASLLLGEHHWQVWQVASADADHLAFLCAQDSRLASIIF
jgi:hypothetical protein